MCEIINGLNEKQVFGFRLVNRGDGYLSRENIDVYLVNRRVPPRRRFTMEYAGGHQEPYHTVDSLHGAITPRLA